MASVFLEEVSKRFGHVTGVDRLNLEVKDREFLVLVGPSGCGKSTTLRMIAGLETVSEGRIYIGDRLVNDVAPKDRDIAMVFQSYALYPHMTVFDNMAFGLRMRGVPRAEIQRRLKEVAESLSLTELLNRKPKQLSGGQRQRVALGRAIVRDPKVFLMDEPLSNLDAKLRVQTRAELIQMHRRLQTTVIYVTHDQTEAMTMGTRIAVMKDGVLQQLDTPDNLYERPANTFVATFIGSPAMNLVEGRLVGAADEVFLESGDFRLAIPGARRRGLSGSIGREVIAGIRPEHIAARGSGEPPNGNDLPARVDVVERLGSDAILYLLAGRNRLVAKTAFRPELQPGRAIDASLDLDHLHLFDPKTHDAIAA
jgi:multiple sugar transport system ATP-binding protein